MRIKNYILRLLLMTFMPWAVAVCIDAQELKAKININHTQVQGTDATVFDELKEKLQEWMDNQKWTSLQFKENERIQCTFNITVSQYNKEAGTWTCSCMIQANRPVYNASYNTTLFQWQDKSFSFTYNQFSKFEFNEEMIDNQLTALFAYYSYLIIGMDLESFSLKGGEDVLQRCLTLCNNAQNLGFPGWDSFEKNTNRFTIINDYMEGAMEPFRTLQYDYYRKGMDEMVNNADRGRTEIATAIETDLKKAHADRPNSMLPQIWTDYKKDELANIFKGKGTEKEKNAVYDVLFNINASQNSSWSKIKE